MVPSLYPSGKTKPSLASKLGSRGLTSPENRVVNSQETHSKKETYSLKYPKGIEKITKACYSIYVTSGKYIVNHFDGTQKRHII